MTYGFVGALTCDMARLPTIPAERLCTAFSSNVPGEYTTNMNLACRNLLRKRVYNKKRSKHRDYLSLAFLLLPRKTTVVADSNIWALPCIMPRTLTVLAQIIHSAKCSANMVILHKTSLNENNT